MDNQSSKRRFRSFILAFLCLSVTLGYAQKSISGKVQDKVSSRLLAGATVQLLVAKDSVIRAGTTGPSGVFTFENLPAGSYKLRASLLGYLSGAQAVQLSQVDLKTSISLDPSEIALEEIEVTATPSVAIRGDTTEYDATKFSTRDLADADELVVQIPGVEIDEEGNIKAHGEDVKKIIVDGKEFFSTDPRIALKTLPAEIIAKIQLIDEKSEQAKFSGFDDGQRSKIINIVTKPDKRKGTFGKASAGYGADNKFAVNSSLNRFDGDAKIAINLLANNVNETNFGEQGRGGRRRDNSNTDRGLSDTYAGAINYNNSLLDEKMDISGDYNFRSGNTDVISETRTEYILGNRKNQLQQRLASSTNKETEHKANARVRWKIDSTQRLDFSPHISFTETNHLSSSSSSSFFSSNDLLNSSERRNDNENSNLNFGGQLTYMYRFSKPGRTTSVAFSGNKSTNDALGENLALTKYYKDAVLSRVDTNNNHSFTDGYGSGYNGRLSLTESLSRLSRLQANYSLRTSQNYSDRKTFEWLAESGQLGELRDRLSNEFRNDYTYHQAGLSYAFNKRDSLRMQIGLNYQHGVRNNDRTFPVNLKTRADFGSFQPEFSLNYNFTKERRIELNYNTATRTPSIEQLQDYVNNQNELRITNGNPNLDQEYNHSVRLQYRDVKRATGQSFNSSFNLDYTNDKIINSVLLTDTAITLFDDVVLGAGGQYVVPVNVDGAWSLRWNNSIGLPIKKWKLNVNLNNNLFYTSNFAMLNEEFLSGYNYGFSQRIGINSNINKNFVSGINYRLNMTFTNNPIAETSTYNIYSHTLGHTLAYEFLGRMVFGSDLLYIYNSGVLDGPSAKTILWNASLGAKILKRKNARIELKGFDIFNQAQNINRRVTDIAVTDVMSNTLTRYFMLSFRYDLRSFGGRDSSAREGSRGDRRHRNR